MAKVRLASCSSFGASVYSEPGLDPAVTRLVSNYTTQWAIADEEFSLRQLMVGQKRQGLLAWTRLKWSLKRQKSRYMLF